MRLFAIARRTLSCGAAAIALVSLAAPPVLAHAAEPKSLYELFGLKEPGLRGAELEAAVSAASAFPLGTEKNPVRTQGVHGQRRYLARLRCSDGRAPKVLGRGIGMPSPFGGVTDIYGVACEGGEPAKANISMDLYHELIEQRPVPGFTIMAAS